jgi:hypothetical protein
MNKLALNILANENSQSAISLGDAVLDYNTMNEAQERQHLEGDPCSELGALLTVFAAIVRRKLQEDKEYE